MVFLREKRGFIWNFLLFKSAFDQPNKVSWRVRVLPLRQVQSNISLFLHERWEEIHAFLYTSRPWIFHQKLRKYFCFVLDREQWERRFLSWFNFLNKVKFFQLAMYIFITNLYVNETSALIFDFVCCSIYKKIYSV